jgi:gp6-like head-tail connector protein
VGATVFYAGQDEQATLTNTFQVNGVNTDPTSVTLTVTDPTGAVTTPAVTKTGTGVYTATISCTTDGIWVYKWDGTGAASDIQEGSWTVGPSTLSQRYCTVEELKSRLGITDTADNFELNRAVEEASRYVDEITGRYFYRATDTRTYVPESISRLGIDDLATTTGLAVKVDRDGDGTFEETWTLGTDYALEVAPGRYNTGAKGEPWPYTAIVVITGGKLFPFTWMWSHLDRVQVTGTFGWPAVPMNVREAALITAADTYKLREAPFGVMGFGEMGVVRVGANMRVQSLLRRYINPSRVGV